MTKNFLALCTAVLSADLLFGCSSDEPSEETFFLEGRYLLSDIATPMIFIEGGAATLSAENDIIFEQFTDGDLIRIEYSGSIAESDPMQIDHVISVELLEEGSYEDLPREELENLIELGWVNDH